MAEFDYPSQAASIARRRELLNAMMARSQAPLESQVAGGMVVPTSSASVMAKLLEGQLAAKQGGQLDAEESGLNQQLAQATRQGMENFYQTQQGRPIQAVGGMPAGQVPANPRKAILDALGSNLPKVAELGASELEAEQKGRLTQKDLSGMATPTSVLANPMQNPFLPGWIPKVNMQSIPSGSVPFDEGGNVFTPGQGAGTGAGFPAPLGGPRVQGLSGRPGYDIVEDAKGNLYQQTATGLDPLNKAPNISNTANILPTPERRLLGNISDVISKQLSDAFATKQQAEKTLVSMNRLAALDEAGAYSGPAANVATVLNSFANELGLPVDTERLANSEEYGSVLASNIAQYLVAGAGVGRSLSEGDRQALEKQFPRLVSSPEGRKQIIGMLKSAAQQNIDYANQAQANLEQKYPEEAMMWSIMPSGQSFPVTPTATTTPGAVPTLAEYLQGLGVTP